MVCFNYFQSAHKSVRPNFKVQHPPAENAQNSSWMQWNRAVLLLSSLPNGATRLLLMYVTVPPEKKTLFSWQTGWNVAFCHISGSLQRTGVYSQSCSGRNWLRKVHPLGGTVKDESSTPPWKPYLLQLSVLHWNSGQCSSGSVLE